MEKLNWLDKHSDASMVIFEVAEEIKLLAHAFKVTGNSMIHRVLMVIAADIETANKNMRDAITESIQESIKRSGDSSKAILEAALAGLKLGEKL